MCRNGISMTGRILKAMSHTIKKMFRRLNPAVPPAMVQAGREETGTDLAMLLNELLVSEFFTESASLTKEQLKGSAVRNCLLQAMMLLDRKYIVGFAMKNFSEEGLAEYGESIRGCCSDKQSVLLRSAVQYLTDAFPEKDKGLTGISIPMLLYLADVAEDAEISPALFRRWWEFFRSEDALYENYRRFCGSDFAELETVNGRLNVMAESFCNYHEIEIPEELEGTTGEVARRKTGT